MCAIPPFCCAEQDSIIQRRKHQRWSELPDGVKVGVRNDLVAALAASSEGTRHGAAQAIAKAGAIDVPAGAWPDLLPGLLSAVSNAGLADGIKAATLRALGYLLEELGLEAVGQSVVNQILTAIVDGMATGRAQEVRREAEALKAQGFRNLLLVAGEDRYMRFFKIDGEKNEKQLAVRLNDMSIHSAKFRYNSTGGSGSGGGSSSNNGVTSSEVVLCGRKPFFYSYDTVNGSVAKIPGPSGRGVKSLEHMEVSPEGGLLAFRGASGYVHICR